MHTVAAAQKQRPPARRLWLASAELTETRRRVGRVDLSERDLQEGKQAEPTKGEAGGGGDKINL